MNKQISWINIGRAICMCCVYFYHSENSGMENLEYSYFFRPFFLEFFFFISGYLMLIPGKRLDIKHKLNSILSKMIWPYFVFTTIIWVPKMIKHGRDIDFERYPAILDSRYFDICRSNGFKNIFSGTTALVL